MIAVVCFAFLLTGFTKDAKGAAERLANLLLVLGGPAAGVILQRRWGGRGILGGAVAGTAVFSLSTAGTWAWLYGNPQIGGLPDPLKQITHSAILGGTYGASLAS